MKQSRLRGGANERESRPNLPARRALKRSFSRWSSGRREWLGRPAVCLAARVGPLQAHCIVQQIRIATGCSLCDTLRDRWTRRLDSHRQRHRGYCDETRARARNVAAQRPRFGLRRWKHEVTVATANVRRAVAVSRGRAVGVGWPAQAISVAALGASVRDRPCTAYVYNVRSGGDGTAAGANSVPHRGCEKSQRSKLTEANVTSKRAMGAKP